MAVFSPAIPSHRYLIVLPSGAALVRAVRGAESGFHTRFYFPAQF